MNYPKWSALVASVINFVLLFVFIEDLISLFILYTSALLAMLCNYVYGFNYAFNNIEITIKNSDKNKSAEEAEEYGAQQNVTKEVAKEYALYCVECYRKELALISLDDYLNNVRYE